MVDFWRVVATDLFVRRLKRYEKKHRAAALAALTNLAKYETALNEGLKLVHIQAGFIHREKQGVIAIDQKGASRKLRETRIYIYPDEKSRTLYLITMGDKNSQTRDLADCRDFMKKLRKREEGNG